MVNRNRNKVITLRCFEKERENILNFREQLEATKQRKFTLIDLYIYLINEYKKNNNM